MTEDMSTEDSNEGLTRMLETFPLGEEELQRVLHLQDMLRRIDCSLEAVMVSPPAELTLVEGRLLPSLFLGNFISKAVSSAFVIGAPNCQHETWTYLEAIVTCLGRRGPRSLHDLIFSYYADDNGTVNTNLLLDFIYRIAVASHVLSAGVAYAGISLETPSSWAKTVSKEQISRPEFVEWITTTVPFVHASVSTLFHYALFSPNHRNFRPAPFSLPRVDQNTLLWSNPWDHVPLSLACISPGLGGKWRRLYSSNEDAFSFRAFSNALVGYKGPTVLMIKTKEGDTFGYYSDCVWKFSSEWFGEGHDSFLFTVHPRVRIFNPTGEGKNYQYLNLPPEHRKDQMKGLAIGGIDHDCPRLHVPESMERCMASSVGRTYENGPLLENEMESYFDIDILEAFAVNVSDDEFKGFQERGALQIAIHESSRKQAASVDRMQFLDDFAAGAFLNKGFEHKEHTSGHQDF